jgi:hypothetical protein
MTSFSETIDEHVDTDNVEFIHANESTAEEHASESVAGLKDHLKTMVPEPYQGLVDEVVVHGPKLVSRMQPLNAGLAVSALGLVVCGVGKYIEHQNKQ